MSVDEDQVLVKKILEGKRSSFEELMRRYNGKIYGYIYRMVKEEEVAVELAQDFFIKLYRVMDKYNPEHRFSTWAFRICYNMVIDYIRKHQQYQVDSLDGEAVTARKMVETDNYVKEDGFDALAQEQFRENLWMLVERIPVKYRELLLLRYHQELKYEEIADMVKLPVGTVKNRLYKAKKYLKKEIEKNGMLK